MCTYKIRKINVKFLYLNIYKTINNIYCIYLFNNKVIINFIKNNPLFIYKIKSLHNFEP